MTNLYNVYNNIYALIIALIIEYFLVRSQNSDLILALARRDYDVLQIYTYLDDGADVNYTDAVSNRRNIANHL